MGVARAGNARRQCNGGIVRDGLSQLVYALTPSKNEGGIETGSDAGSERSRGGDGRRTDKKLPVPDGSDGTYADDRCDCFDLDQHDNCRRYGDRRRGMQNDAQRAMVSIGIDGVDVRHLDDGEQRKQRQTHHHDRGGGT